MESVVKDEKFFIEIGTCDFDTFEHLAAHGWKGIFVEPVKEYLDKLQRFDGCVYENCAVLDTMDTMPLLLWDPERAQDWIKGVSTLNMVKNCFYNPEFQELHPEWEEHTLQRDVPVVTLDHLIEKHQVTRIDYLKIDIEGWEHRILDDYSWKIKPDILKIEYKHWQYQEIPVKKYIMMLEGLGYIVKKVGANLLGVLK